MSPFLTLWTYLQSRTAEREEGLVAVEDAVLGGAIVLIIIGVAAAFGTKLGLKFDALLP